MPNVTLRERGYNKPLYNAPVAVSQDFLRFGRLEGGRGYFSGIPDRSSSSDPDSNPSKKAVTELFDEFTKMIPTCNPTRRTPTAYDSGVVLKMVATEALKVAKPWYRRIPGAIRDRLHTINGLVGSVGVYQFKPGQPYGVQENSIVFVNVKDGKWAYLESSCRSLDGMKNPKLSRRTGCHCNWFGDFILGLANCRWSGGGEVSRLWAETMRKPAATSE